MTPTAPITQVRDLAKEAGRRALDTWQPTTIVSLAVALGELARHVEELEQRVKELEKQ